MYWTLLTFVNTMGFVDGRERTSVEELWKEQAQLTILVILGFIFTHMYRAYVKKNKWISLSVPKLITRLVLSAFLLIFLIGTTFIIAIAMANLVSREDLLNSGHVLGAYIGITPFTSLWVAIYFSVQYFKNYRKSQVLQLKQDALIKEATLNKLRSQLNPHFVFNSLNSIRALVIVEPNKARDSITALSNIFRKSLQLDKALRIPFDEELQIVKDYLKLEKIRFEERLEIVLDIEPDVYASKVPPLMLQTLVENGIKHGISSLAAGGVLQLKGRDYQKSFHFEIINSGRLRHKVGGRKGYGLQNTRERLELLYDGRASITIENFEEDRVLTTLIIPKEQEGQVPGTHNGLREQEAEEASTTLKK